MPKLTRENVTLHYEMNGTGEPLLYIPGFSDHSNSLFSIGVREKLSDKYRVFCLDNRGSGQTLVGENAPVTIEDMADDAAALLQDHDLDQAHVLGISMGGAVAQVLALRHPELVRSLVIAVSMALTEQPSRAGHLLETVHIMRARNIDLEIINRFTATFLFSEATFKYEPFIAAWISAPEDPLGQTAEGFVQQSNALRDFDIREQIKTINIPALIISSPDDMLVPMRFQDEIAALIPDAQIKRYPGGHIFIGLPMYREPFFEDVFAFWDNV